jgi:hypothetical protein
VFEGNLVGTSRRGMQFLVDTVRVGVARAIHQAAQTAAHCAELFGLARWAVGPSLPDEMPADIVKHLQS